MLAYVIILVTVMGAAAPSTTQPSAAKPRVANPRFRVAAPTTRPTTKAETQRPARRFTVAKEQAAQRKRPVSATRPAGKPAIPPAAMKPGVAATLSGLGELSGDRVEVEALSDGNLVIYANEQDLAILESLVTFVDSQAPPMTFRLFQLKAGQANDLGKKIQEFWDKAKAPAKGAIRPEDRLTVIPEERSNTLMVAASEANMEEIAAIIDSLDKPTLSDTVIPRPFRLKHIKAVEAEQVLKDMLDALQKRRKTTTDLFDIKSLARTNTLLITAPEEDLKQIEQIIALIDVEPMEETGGISKMAFVQLERAVADDLAASLNEMLKGETDIAKAMEEQVRRLQVVEMASGRELKPVDLEKPIKIIPEKGSNSIIVASVEQNLGPLIEIIKLLDSVPVADEMLVKIFPLQFADAEALQASLKDMFDQGKRLGEQPGKTVPGRIPRSLPGAALAYEIGLSVDKRTNTLVVSGRAEQLLLIEKIVNSVDIKETANRFRPRLIKLERAAVASISEVTSKLSEYREKMAERLSPTEAERERIEVIPDVRTNSLIVIANEENFKEIAKLAKELDGAEEDWLGQFRIINLENLTATDIAEKIESLWERRAEIRREGGLPEDKPVIVTDSRSNSLVIAANPEDQDAIAKLVARLEQQKLSPLADIRQVHLKHNDATKVGETVGQLFDERLQISKAKGEEEQPSERVFITADAMTNTLLIASSKSNYEQIVQLVTRLDVPLPVEGVLRTFYVRNADVTKAAKMLEDLFEKGVYRGSGTQEIPEALKSVTIVTDVRSSALLVSGSPENLAIVEALLTEIDRIDTPIFQADARFIPVKYADVVNVAGVLEQVFEGMQKALGDESDQLELKIVPNIRSRVLVVAGSRYAMKRAEDLVAQLDTPLQEPAYEMKVYKLQEQSASKVEPIMTELFEKRSSGEQAADITPITILADDGSNSLIISASSDDHLEVTKLIEKLDQPSLVAQQTAIIPLEFARADQIADTLSELLKAQQGEGEEGFAVTAEPRTNNLIVFASPSMMSNIRTIVAQLDNSKPKSELAMRTFRLHQAQAEELSKLLEEFFEAAGAGESEDAKQLIIQFSPTDPVTGKPVIDPITGATLVKTLVHQDITIKPDKYTNSLMVMAPKDHIDMLQMLIEMLDSIEPVTAEIVPFKLRNADAEEMRELLENLFETEGGDGERGRTLIFGEGEAAPAGGEGGDTTLELAFSVDRRTNTLIAAGTPAYLRIVERLVYQLDDEEIEERIVRVMPLQYGKAEDVAATLSDYFEKEAGLLEEAEGEVAAARRLQREVTITDGGETANTLLLSYSPRMEPQILTMINELDRPPPQVMIQVLIAEVTLDDRFELGVEFAVQDLLFSEKAYMSQNGTIKGDHCDLIGGTDLGAAGTTGLGGISFTVTGEDFNFLIRALQTEGRLEVLSRPAILVQDNQEANITVGERVPTVQDLTVSAGGLVTPSVSYEDVGIILDVKPIINPDGFVNLEISPEISSIGTSSVSVATGVTLPTFTERSAETSVTVKDGETVIIGGLITSRTNATENKVPLAGDIPILGNLFRATVQSTTKTELLFVLTPHIIRETADARRISLEMRDQTGLMDETRRSPLLQSLQVRPEEDQFGPVTPLIPSREPVEGEKETPELGPVLDEYGPPTTSLQYGPSRAAVLVGSRMSDRRR